MPSSVIDPGTTVIQRRSLLGSWRLVEPLGRGAFGTTWLATDPTGRRGVVKLLPEPPGDELRALQRVFHPAVVRCLHASAHPVPHLVMALAPGAPLAQVDRASLADERLHELMVQLWSALAACHRAGVSHGDIKPHNILYDLDAGVLTVVDFGLAGGRGGTPRYAAPEVLASQGASAAADVYSAALVLWEALHQALPHAEEEWLVAMKRLEQQAPSPTAGPLWVRDQLRAALSPDPAARPTAEMLADVWAAHGYSSPSPTAQDLWQRARTARVARPVVDDAVNAWLVQRGALMITGPDGSGRSHALRAAVDELVARGRTVVSLAPGAHPWSAIEAALADPGLPGRPRPLPDGQDAITRAKAVAKALADRCSSDAWLVVDDLHAFDDGSRRAVREMVRLGFAVLTAGTTAVAWISEEVALEPWTEQQAETWLVGLIGGVDRGALVRDAFRRVGRWPADLLAYVMGAVRGRGLVHRRGGWTVDEPTLERLEASCFGAPASLPEALSDDSRLLGAAVGLLQPIAVQRALRIAGVDRAALTALLDHGWVQGRHLLTCPTERHAAALRAGVADHVPLWRGVIAWHRETGQPPSGLLGWALAGAADRAGIARDGEAAVRAALALDVADGAALAKRLAQVCPTPQLRALWIDAAVRAGEAESARTAGAAWLAERPPSEEDLPILLAMARLEDAASEAPPAILAWTERARAVLGDAPTPAGLTLLEGRARFRGGDLDRADGLVAELCRDSAAVDPEWLEARGLLAQIRAERLGPEAGLAVLEVDPAIGAGTGQRALLEGVKGRLLWMARRPRQAADAMTRAAAQRHALTTVDRARLENNAALCWYAAGDVERAVVGWQSALVAFELLGADLEILRVEVNLCQGYTDLGRWARAATSGQRAIQLARVHGVVAYEAVAVGNLGDVAAWRRRFREADRLYDTCEGLLQPGDHASRVELLRRRVELAAHRLSPHALPLATAAVTLAGTHGDPEEQARTLAVRSLLRARAGQGAAASEDAQAALAALRGRDATGVLAVVRLWVAETSLALGEVDAARRLANEAKRYAEEFGRVPLRSWADDLMTWTRTPSNDQHHRLELLTELGALVTSQLEEEGLFRELARAAVRLIDAERAFVVMGQPDALEVVAQAGECAGGARPSFSIVRRTLALGREIVVTDMDERADLQQSESVVSMELKAAMCAPLFVDGAVQGALYLDSQEQPMAALGDAVALVRSLAAHASVALGNARLTTQVRGQVQRAREVAHDLRNPLAGVVLLLEAVAEDEVSLSPDDAARAVRDLRHALELVHGALSQEKPAIRAFPWQPAVVAWCGSLAGQARQAGVRVEVDGDPVTGSVLGRPTALRRAVTNVLSNALKYTPRGGLVVVTPFADGQRVGLVVQDQGPGIDADELEHIFEPGVQAPGAAEGHGLGLPIARRICREHGGDVRAEPAAQGARFMLWVPQGDDRAVS
ncbi:MAG: protein kinase [Myxococcales bacterium]|nr:protein kinase [Myxococcales bacterium]